jgi:hypothetical protein
MHVSALGTSSALAALACVCSCSAGSVEPAISVPNGPPSVMSIALIPATAVVRGGGARRFDVEAKWTGGYSTPPALTWTVVGGGSVDVFGTYTAPPGADTVLVIAALRDGRLADTATVVVEAQTDSTRAPVDTVTVPIDSSAAPIDSSAVPVDSLPVPPPVDSLTPPVPPTPQNEPAGFLPIVGRRFDAIGTGSNGRGAGTLPWKTGGSEGFDDAESRYANTALVQDSSAPLSPGGVLRFTYPARDVAAGSTFNPGVVQTLPFSGPAYGSRSYRRMYVRTAFRVSANWQGHPTATNKLVFFRAEGQVHHEPILRLRGTGNGSLVLNVDLQGSPRDRRNVANSSLNPNTAESATAGAWNIQRGQWYVVEVLLEAGQNGAANGKLRIWVNGVLTHTYEDIEYDALPTRDGRWDTLHVAPTWGGQGGKIHETMWLDFDEFYVSGAP